MSAEVRGKEAFAELDRVPCVHLIKAMRLPGLLASLDDHGRHVGAELVRVDLEPAMLGLLKGECKFREGLRSAEPYEAAFAHIDIRLEDARVPVARSAIDTVCRDDKVGIANLGLVAYFVLEVLLDA